MRRHTENARRPTWHLGVDALGTALSLQASALFDLDGRPTSEYLAILPTATLVLVGARLLAFVMVGADRWPLDRADPREGARFGLAMLVGSALFALTPASITTGRLPTALYALEFFVTASLLGCVRFGPLLAREWRSARGSRVAGERLLARMKALVASNSPLEERRRAQAGLASWSNARRARGGERAAGMGPGRVGTEGQQYHAERAFRGTPGGGEAHGRGDIGPAPDV